MEWRGRVDPIRNPNFTAFHVFRAVRKWRGDQWGTRGHSAHAGARCYSTQTGFVLSAFLCLVVTWLPPQNSEEHFLGLRPQWIRRSKRVSTPAPNLTQAWPLLNLPMLQNVFFHQNPIPSVQWFPTGRDFAPPGALVNVWRHSQWFQPRTGVLLAPPASRGQRCC